MNDITLTLSPSQMVILINAINDSRIQLLLQSRTTKHNYAPSEAVTRITDRLELQAVSIEQLQNAIASQLTGDNCRDIAQSHT